MWNATRGAFGFLDLIRQSDPGLRHIKQSNFAPAIRKPLRDFEAMGGVQPVARSDFAGRHPHPQYVFSQKPKDASLFRVPKKNSPGGLIVPAIFHDGSAGYPQGTPGAHADN